MAGATGMNGGADPGLAVVIVAYNAAGFVADCLESLFAARLPGMKVVVVDNGSRDGTADAVRDWANGIAPELRTDWPFAPDHRAPRPTAFAEHDAARPPAGALPPLTLIRTHANLGFAGGVNRGLRALLADPETDLFWLLNPDTVVPPDTPSAFLRAARAMGRFAAIGGRIVFLDAPGLLQSDGGRLAPLTGAIEAVHFAAPLDQTAPPNPETLDFISGAAMVVSRDFVTRAGLMDERYFLYCEEIDWQLRRGDLPLGLAADAIVLHRAGASIGSAGRGKPSPLAVYFSHRNGLRVTARWHPWHLPLAYARAWIKMARQWDGTLTQFAAFLTGLHQLPPPRSLRPALDAAAWQRATMPWRQWTRPSLAALLHSPGPRRALRRLRPLHDWLTGGWRRPEPDEAPAAVLAELADRLVVVLALGRSGTTVFGQFLASHPDVVTLGEVLNEQALHSFVRRRRRPSQAQARFYPWLRDRANRFPGKRVVIDMKFESLHLIAGNWRQPGYEHEFVALLAEASVPVILLERRDHLARWQSHERAKESGRFHSFQPPPDLAPAGGASGSPEAAIARSQAQVAAARAQLAGHPRMLDLAYEDLFEPTTGGGQRFAWTVVEQVAALLDLPPWFDCAPRLRQLAGEQS